jgi:hypothetical protein
MPGDSPRRARRYARISEDDLIWLGRDSVVSRLSARRARLIQTAAAGLIGASLLATFLVRTAGKHVPSMAPPAAVVGLSARLALIPTVASVCANNACTSSPATDEELLAGLGEFFGATYIVRGDRVRDRHGVLRGLSVCVRDISGDGVQLHAIESRSAPAHWTGSASLDRTVLVTGRSMHTTEGLCLVESDSEPLLHEDRDANTVPLWRLAEIGAYATQLHL